MHDGNDLSITSCYGQYKLSAQASVFFRPYKLAAQASPAFHADPKPGCSRILPVSGGKYSAMLNIQGSMFESHGPNRPAFSTAAPIVY
jgi:hypothetical protein